MEPIIDHRRLNDLFDFNVEYDNGYGVTIRNIREFLNCKGLEYRLFQYKTRSLVMFSLLNVHDSSRVICETKTPEAAIEEARKHVLHIAQRRNWMKGISENGRNTKILH